MSFESDGLDIHLIGGTPASCGATWNSNGQCWLFPNGTCIEVSDWDEYIPDGGFRRWGGLLFVLIGGLVLIALLVFLMGKE